MNGAQIPVPENMSRITGGNYNGCYVSYRDLPNSGRGSDKDRKGKDAKKDDRKNQMKRENFMYAPVDRFRPDKNVKNKTRKVKINGKEYYALKINHSDPTGVPFLERTMGYKDM